MQNSNKTETQMVRPDKWWEQRESVTRSLIYKKRYKLLTKLLANTLYHQVPLLQKQSGYLDG